MEIPQRQARKLCSEAEFDLQKYLQARHVPVEPRPPVKHLRKLPRIAGDSAAEKAARKAEIFNEALRRMEHELDRHS